MNAPGQLKFTVVIDLESVDPEVSADLDEWDVKDAVGDLVGDPGLVSVLNENTKEAC